MSGHWLRLFEDTLAPGASRALPARPRVLYVRAGALEARADGPAARVAAGAAWHAAGACEVTAGPAVASVLRWELARERREIREHPSEEVAELIAALTARGLGRADAVEVARRIARSHDLLLSMLAVFELGLAPQQLGRPARDAFVMGMAFAAASLVPLVPFVWPRAMAALAVSGALTLVALFAVGALKGRLAHLSALRGGLEVVGLGAASAIVSFALGRLASQLFGLEVA